VRSLRINLSFPAQALWKSSEIKWRPLHFLLWVGCSLCFYFHVNCQADVSSLLALFQVASTCMPWFLVIWWAIEHGEEKSDEQGKISSILKTNIYTHEIHGWKFTAAGDMNILPLGSHLTVLCILAILVH
jgi:hypothetical protein